MISNVSFPTGKYILAKYPNETSEESKEKLWARLWSKTIEIEIIEDFKMSFYYFVSENATLYIDIAFNESTDPLARIIDPIPKWSKQEDIDIFLSDGFVTIGESFQIIITAELNAVNGKVAVSQLNIYRNEASESSSVTNNKTLIKQTIVPEGNSTYSNVTPTNLRNCCTSTEYDFLNKSITKHDFVNSSTTEYPLNLINCCISLWYYLGLTICCLIGLLLCGVLLMILYEWKDRRKKKLKESNDIVFVYDNQTFPDIF
ncbi:uncharacterized protein LOC111625645 [Centruroides sculpturatus]|uniref:uncharacterized protein LOC111625645 n=1 Tax=Centruroides sculpturatus TaxID=218467 RepID=UPI000C6DBB22|nr:uncharacterized protein LOC111625645 [Centruroides sculpturatus]